MTEEKAMYRLIKAIENPYTTILGHPTGRLLLSRAGYPVDNYKLIDACAANGV
jgi:DNA polymerase (family 10)